MKCETEQYIEENQAKSEAQFKDMVFANNPKLYEALFGQESISDEELETGDFEYIEPQNEEEARELLAELQSFMD